MGGEQMDSVSQRILVGGRTPLLFERGSGPHQAIGGVFHVQVFHVRVLHVEPLGRTWSQECVLGAVLLKNEF